MSKIVPKLEAQEAADTLARAWTKASEARHLCELVLHMEDFNKLGIDRKQVTKAYNAANKVIGALVAIRDNTKYFPEEWPYDCLVLIKEDSDV